MNKMKEIVLNIHQFLHHITTQTDSHGNAPGLYSRGTQFESWPGH